MRTAPTSSEEESNPDVKQALERGQFHAYKLRTTPADATSPTYELSIPFFEEGTPTELIKFRRGLQAVLKGQNVTQGPPSYAVAKTLLKGDMLTVFKQVETTHGNQTVTNFKLCLDDMANHVFLEKSGQIQKRYMQRNIQYRKDMSVKEWVARVSELNSYLKDFPAHNKNPMQPIDADELLDILKYGVPLSWHREFTMQGFYLVDQGWQKFVEFCTHLESCEPSKVKQKDKKPAKLKTAGKHKAKVLTTSTSSA
eukprot:15343961-Ditylum_brightwellii.AAC.1